MAKITRVGVDLAKNVFHIHAVDENEKTVWQGKYSRSNWIKAVVKRTPQTATIGMEACGSAHHWARELIKLGYDVKPTFRSQFRNKPLHIANQEV